jgi:hypothetical protein
MKVHLLFENAGALSVDEIAAFLKEHCKEYLQSYNGNPLFRGVTQEVESLKIKKTHSDRKPRDSSSLFSDTCSAYLKNKFGHDYRTSNVLFCSKASHVTKMYGKFVYVVIPVGEFNGCYSNVIEDLYTIVTNPMPWMNLGSDFINKMATLIGIDDVSDKDQKTQMVRYFIQAVSANPVLNPESGDDTKVEKIINTMDGYILKTLKKSEDESDVILNKVKKIIKDGTKEYFDIFLDQMNFKESTDFSKVSKAHEIMLKCKEYIVLPGNNHDELVKIFDAI